MTDTRLPFTPADAAQALLDRAQIPEELLPDVDEASEWSFASREDGNLDLYAPNGQMFIALITHP